MSEGCDKKGPAGSGRDEEKTRGETMSGKGVSQDEMGVSILPSYQLPIWTVLAVRALPVAQATP
jgi:hypothetical protein